MVREAAAAHHSELGSTEDPTMLFQAQSSVQRLEQLPHVLHCQPRNTRDDIGKRDVVTHAGRAWASVPKMVTKRRQNSVRSAIHSLMALFSLPMW